MRLAATLSVSLRDLNDVRVMSGFCTYHRNPTPARDARGRAVTGSTVGAIRWVLPKEEPEAAPDAAPAPRYAAGPGRLRLRTAAFPRLKADQAMRYRIPRMPGRLRG